MAAAATGWPRWLDGEDHEQQHFVGAITTSERELTEDDLGVVSGGKPSAAKSSPAPKISESLSLSYEEVKFEYTEQ